ncbi:MAG: DUF362 domain-containing protein [Desulfovibrio sp.]|nr:DUF362 domain-containing protein [Desulfovibrio sp.]
MDRRYFLKGAAALTGAVIMTGAANAASDISGVFPKHGPLGEPRGINPGRVTWQHDPSSVSWDRVDYWWKPENYNEGAIAKMIADGLIALTGATSAQKAWEALFAWNNQENGKPGGYRAGQKMAIKTNMNGAGEYNDDPHGRIASPYGNPVLLKVLLLSLVEDGTVEPGAITIFDTCRIFPDYMRAMCTSGKLAGIQFRYRDEAGEMDATPDKNAPIEWSGPVDGETTWFPSCLTEADYLINLANLKGHSWGMTLGAKNHFGSFVNSDRRRTPAAAGLHDNIINGKMNGYSVLADLIANPQINAKTILWILDALITAPSETGNITPASARWEMAPFNGGYACSLFFSQDPIAIDSVGADFLVNEPNMLKHNRGLAVNRDMENYLHEAALLPAPPSGLSYRFNSRSLGVHEHWNNAQDKRYAGNQKPGSGIELLYHRS